MRVILLFVLCLLFISCTKNDAPIPQLTVEKSSTRFSLMASGELEAVTSTPITSASKTQRPQTIAWIIDQYAHVKKGDVIVRFDGVPFQLEVDAAEYEISKLQFSKNKKQREMDLSIADFNNEEEVVNFEYLMAKKFNIDDPLLYTKIEMIEASDNEEFLEAKTQHLQKMESHYQDKSLSEVNLIDSQSEFQKSKIDVNRENLESLEIKAPHDGIVVLKKSWDDTIPQAGKSVFPGMKLASLPDLSSMQAKIYVPEVEAVGIKQGQSVDISLHAFPDLKFTGTVTQISNTAQPKKRDNPIKYFIVNVLINEQDQQKLLPGQRLDAVIFTSDESENIVVPIQTIFREGEDSWVYLKEGNSFNKRFVTTGLCSTSQCQIDAGLKENDVIALVDPEQVNKEEAR
ncbi:MAG: efflux RND transporter periplasmic adaptor subunit [Gammaproteobacteria bacterium]